MLLALRANSNKSRLQSCLQATTPGPTPMGYPLKWPRSLRSLQELIQRLELLINAGFSGLFCLLNSQNCKNIYLIYFYRLGVREIPKLSRPEQLLCLARLVPLG